MKTMVSYRMRDIDLEAIDRIKEMTTLETSTEVIREAIWWLEMSLRREKKPMSILKVEYLPDKSSDLY